MQTCLRCNRRFLSTWRGHRCCRECEKAVAIILAAERASYHTPRRDYDVLTPTDLRFSDQVPA